MRECQCCSFLATDMAPTKFCRIAGDSALCALAKALNKSIATLCSPKSLQHGRWKVTRSRPNSTPVSVRCDAQGLSTVTTDCANFFVEAAPQKRPNVAVFPPGHQPPSGVAEKKSLRAIASHFITTNRVELSLQFRNFPWHGRTNMLSWFDLFRPHALCRRCCVRTFMPSNLCVRVRACARVHRWLTCWGGVRPRPLVIDDCEALTRSFGGSELSTSSTSSLD